MRNYQGPEEGRSVYPEHFTESEQQKVCVEFNLISKVQFF